MSEHRAEIRWRRQTEDFEYDTYNRAHRWSFDSGVAFPATAAAEFKGDSEGVDPEEGFVAAVSACHMLTFLAIAARKRFTVDSYEDDAVGVLEKNEEGKLAITRVTLHPRVRFGGDKEPDPQQLERLHHQAHEHCFIANSVRTKVEIAADAVA